MRTRLAQGLLVALLLVGCDQGARAELADLREDLAAQKARTEELQARLDRLELELAVERRERARALALSPGAPPPEVPADEPPPAEPPTLPVTCTAGRCKLPRAAFAALMADPAALVKTARVIPNIKDGVTRGFKLFAIRANSPLATIGLKNGDLVTEIGGQAMGSVEAVIRATEGLGARKEWSIKGERQGAPFELVIELQD